LKAAWPDPQKAARRIAGHANAARGAEILWLIGVDEARGVVGAQANEMATWFPQVEANFDGLAPAHTDLIVPTTGQSLVAVLFETERAPFVVKNPAYGQTGGGPVELEVPWRDGTRVRSARRSEMVRLLSPLAELPSLDVETGFGVDPNVGPLFGVKAVNSGSVPITITEIYLLLGWEDGAEKRMYMPTLATGAINGVSLPCRLEPGDPRSFVQAREPLRDDLRSQGYERDAKLTLVVKDSLGNSYETPANP